MRTSLCEIDLFESAVDLQTQDVCSLQVDPFTKIHISLHLSWSCWTAGGACAIKVKLVCRIIAERHDVAQCILLSSPPPIELLGQVCNAKRERFRCHTQDSLDCYRAFQKSAHVTFEVLTKLFNAFQSLSGLVAPGGQSIEGSYLFQIIDLHLVFVGEVDPMGQHDRSQAVFT